MKYIFEDHPNSFSALLFNAGYSARRVRQMLTECGRGTDSITHLLEFAGYNDNEIREALEAPDGSELNDERFIYTEGNGNIYDIADKLLSNPDDGNERVVIYYDMVPGVRDEKTIYYKFKNLVHKYADKVIVLPIPCSEYYIIKAFKDAGILKSGVDVQPCIDRQWYGNSSLLGQKTARNFEKFCKHIIRECFIECASSDSRDTGSWPEKNKIFYRDNCKCGFSISTCQDMSLILKAAKLLASYPCVPAGCKVGTYSANGVLVKQIVNDLIQIHKALVKSYNDMSDLFEEKDPEASIKKYSHIYPLYN